LFDEEMDELDLAIVIYECKKRVKSVKGNKGRGCLMERIYSKGSARSVKGKE
jgi:hypothetical protein